MGKPITAEGVKKKPDIVLNYNRTKGGVDTMDQMCLNYTSKRQTKRWPLVIFNNMLDTSILALGVIFKIQDARNSLAVWQRPGPYEQLTRALMTWNFAGKIVKTVYENIPALIHCFKTSFQRGQGTRRQSCRHMGLTVDGPGAATGAESRKRGRCGLCYWKL